MQSIVLRSLAGIPSRSIAATKSLVATVGALSNPVMLEDIIASGKADIVEIARGLICDPDLPNKARNGRDEEIVHCMRCFSCFSNLMKYGGFFCALNPMSGRERTFGRLLPEAKRQKVLVVGGGIGGMQAALTAVQNGHDVILCEKSSRLGGSIRCEENVSFKNHLKEYIEQREQLIAKSAIDLRLNTEISPEYAKSIDADVIIAALGAIPIKPAIPGIDGENVMGAEEDYSEPELVGKSDSGVAFLFPRLSNSRLRKAVCSLSRSRIQSFLRIHELNKQACKYHGNSAGFLSVHYRLISLLRVLYYPAYPEKQNQPPLCLENSSSTA